MRDVEDIARLLESTPRVLALLKVVAALQLPDGCIAAGLVRNAVWDALHGREVSLHPRSDVDVLYFDPAQLARDEERRLEARLGALRPDIPWQVRNQARMHLRNQDPPYAGSVDALRYFPETATAIGARWGATGVVVDAPLGIQDLLALRVRPTPTFRARPEAYRARLATKDWAARWPRLRFESPT